jgi:hypothetical protein
MNITFCSRGPLKRPSLGRTRRRWEYSLNMDLKATVVGIGDGWDEFRILSIGEIWY